MTIQSFILKDSPFSSSYPLDLFTFVKPNFVVYGTLDKFSCFKYGSKTYRKNTLKFSDVSFIFSENKGQI